MGEKAEGKEEEAAKEVKEKIKRMSKKIKGRGSGKRNRRYLEGKEEEE